LAIVSPREFELGAEEPSREVDGALGGAYRGRDARQRNGSVHQHFDVIACAWRKGVRSDVRRGRIQGALPTDSPQAAAMMEAHGALDRVAEGRVDTPERFHSRRSVRSRRGSSGALSFLVARSGERNRRILDEKLGLLMIPAGSAG
jgi:hypothetical protein